MDVWKATGMRSDGTWCIPNRQQIMVSKKKITFTDILIDLKVISLKFYNLSVKCWNV